MLSELRRRIVFIIHFDDIVFIVSCYSNSHVVLHSTAFKEEPNPEKKRNQPPARYELLSDV